MSDSGLTYRGKPIEELTREELIKAVTYLAKRNREMQEELFADPEHYTRMVWRKVFGK